MMMAGFTDSEAFLADHDRLADLVFARNPSKPAKLAGHIASTLRYVYPTPPETA